MDQLIRPIRSLNPLAVVVIVLLHMGIGAAWYGLLANPWMEAVGKTEAEFAGMSPAIYLLPIVAALLNTWVLAVLLDRLGRRSLVSGTGAALLLWVGLIVPYDLVHNTFSAFSVSLTIIDTGGELLSLLATGIVLAVWPLRVPSPLTTTAVLRGSPSA